ncbi:MAG: hypothetical protein WBF90_33285 [Rivularia sp. (in: cyanobacteria)]
MTGLNPFSIEKTDQFKRTFKKLVKAYGDDFFDLVAEILENLIEEQYPINSRQEPLPKKVQLPEGWTFHKLEFKYRKGASGQIRLMYLVNDMDCIIRLMWIYSHEQFAKRPGDKELKTVLKEALNL